MAYVTPTTRADGYVVPASTWNQDVVDNPIAIRTGAIAVTSQATGDVIVASSATQLARVAPGASGTVLTSNGVGVAPSFAVAAGYLTLLKANSGTTTNAAAENVDTISITGLTALDTVRVIFTFESVTQLTTTPLMYNSTDGVSLLNIANGGNCSAGATHQGEFTLRPRQGSTVNLAATYQGNGSFNAVVSGGGTPTVTTAWTGAWTLAFRHGGVTAGGTFKWSWSVFKIAGQ